MDQYSDVVNHYEERYEEGTRLEQGALNQLELIRTRIVMDRHLPDPPATVLDVGGGPGVYAALLNDAGYDVELIDIVPRHIRQATARGVRAQLGDARELPIQTKTQDAVLLLGPLYHLIEREQRLAALAETVRVAKAGAPVFAAAISRYAPAIDGLDSGYWDDPAFVDIVIEDLETGCHTNPTGNPQYFTTAFFHRPGDLRSELEESGLQDVQVLAVEGIGWAAHDLEDRLANGEKRAELLRLIERLEREDSILGASPHLLGIGWVQ